MSIVKCPVCQSDVQAGFGMVVCPQCRTPLFFDFDGNLQMASDEPEQDISESDDPLKQNNYEAESYSSESNENHSLNLDQQYTTESKSLSGFSVESYALVSLAEIEHSEQSEQSDNNEHNENSEFIDDSIYQNEMPESSTSSETILAEKAIASSQDTFIYKIIIKGIDGSRLRSEIYEELKDPRWGWVALEIMNQIQSGELILSQVNGVKASLLINRLKALPIEITWMVDNENSNDQSLQL